VRNVALRALAATLAVVAFSAPAAQAQFMTGQRIDRERTVSQAQLSSRDLLNRVGFDQKLGGALPLDLEFRDESGRTVRLGDYFGARPVVLAMVYYTCPVLCTLVERGVAAGLKPLTVEPGRDFDVVFVSIDSKDTPQTAAERKAATLDRYGRAATAGGWHFLSGDEASIVRLAEAVGFRYALDPVTGQYAHAAGITVATPGGKLSRYLYGVEYAPRDLKLALVESSEGKVGTPVDRALLLCFRYDEHLGKYTAATMLFLKLGATATLAAVVLFLVLSLRRERRARQLAAGGMA
jgi:protein SCO1/2